ncbi:MAG TPA: universal stress protein [Longimicrobium sp.]|nr:universal stress protein [Longimicrobium sp.]
MTEHAGSTSHGHPDRPGGSFRSVLVATDLSEDSDLLVHAAAAIASRSGAALHVVHSADVLSAGDTGSGGSFAERVAAAESAVDQQISRVVPPSLQVGRHVGASAPDRTIMEAAERVAADLIVLGPHVRGAAPSRLLGTTAEQVLSGAGVPCLVVRNPLAEMARHVTAAVDPGHVMSSVLDVATRWTLLFSDPENSRRPTLAALYITGDREDGPPPALTQALRDALDRSGAGTRVDAAVEVRGTHDVESIVLYAEVEATDLLVLSTRSRGVLGRALLGSVSAEVTRRAPCNVLLVPPARED